MSKILLSLAGSILSFTLWFCAGMAWFCTGTATAEPLKVGIRPAPPFVMESELHGLEGISVDLWEAIARRLAVETRYVRFDSVDGTLEALREGSVDLVIAPLTITREREEMIDFSHQYFRSGLTVATRPDHAFDLARSLKVVGATLVSPSSLFVIGIVAAATILYATIAYANRHQYKEWDEISAEPRLVRMLHFCLHGLVRSFGMDDDIFRFRSLVMQVASLLMLLFGITMVGGYIGLVSASLTSGMESARSYAVEDLEGARVGVLERSTAQQFVAGISAPNGREPSITAYHSLKEALDGLVRGETDVVLGDWVQLTFFARQGPYRDRLLVQDETLQFEPYGWGLPVDSPWRDTINRELIGILRSPEWPGLVRRHLGEGVVSPQ
jgi:ABC-type amino acid transport substrate-binding protein